MHPSNTEGDTDFRVTKGSNIVCILVNGSEIYIVQNSNDCYSRHQKAN